MRRTPKEARSAVSKDVFGHQNHTDSWFETREDALLTMRLIVKSCR